MPDPASVGGLSAKAGKLHRFNHLDAFAQDALRHDATAKPSKVTNSIAAFMASTEPPCT
jgi:hypothetical protein